MSTGNPETVSEAMQIAREFTNAGTEQDQRTTFDVYLDLARIGAHVDIGPSLKDVPISDSHKKDILECAAYDAAQPAHLEDASANKPTHLIDMLNKLGAINLAIATDMSSTSEANREMYPLSEVTTRDHYLIKEHFDEIEEQVGRKYPKGFIGRAYAELVYPKRQYHGQRTGAPSHMEPIEVGLVVAEREDLDLPRTKSPYTASGKRALQAGSFLDFMAKVNSGEMMDLDGLGDIRKEFFNQAAVAIELQIEAAQARNADKPE